MYFITICGLQRRCIFGQILENKALLSPIGKITKDCWIEIPQHFPNVKLETYVVMPNHLHGILTIDARSQKTKCKEETIILKEAFGRPSPGSIPTIVRSFTSAASRRARESGLVVGESIWQRGYFEHVLRNTRDFVETTNYILQNPARWAYEEDNLNAKSRGARNP
jgi:REP element-mobilizing transposase RayT